jgi:hypothetical protein
MAESSTARTSRLRPGVAWVAAFLVYMALLGGARNVLGGGVGIAPFVVVALALSTAMWWFTASLMLKGQVRPRVLLPSGLITAVALLPPPVRSLRLADAFSPSDDRHPSRARTTSGTFPGRAEGRRVTQMSHDAGQPRALSELMRGSLRPHGGLPATLHRLASELARK